MGELSVADVLERAADLIEPEGAWTRGGAGRDASGRLVRPQEIDRACRYCAIGAIWKAAGNPFEAVRDFVIYECFPTLNKTIGWKRGFGNWNDAPDRTQSEVVAKLREAAALARAKGESDAG